MPSRSVTFRRRWRSQSAAGPRDSAALMKTLAGSRVDAAQVSLERKGKEEKEEEEHAAVGKKKTDNWF